MPDFSEINRRLELIGQAVRDKLPEISTKMTLAAKALAERRIKDEGFGEVYSETVVPSWFLHGKELNKSGAAFLEKVSKSKFRLTNWKELRNAQGLQTDHVDLSYTNKMWANMQPQDAIDENGIIRTPLGATNTEAQNKMNWNRDRYGDFVGRALHPEDFGALFQFVADEVISVLETF